MGPKSDTAANPKFYCSEDGPRPSQLLSSLLCFPRRMLPETCIMGHTGIKKDGMKAKKKRTLEWVHSASHWASASPKETPLSSLERWVLQGITLHRQPTEALRHQEQVKDKVEI